MPPMMLSDLLERFLIEHEIGVSASTVQCWYLPAIADFERYLGRSPLVSDFKRTTVNQWIQSKVEQSVSPSTTRTRRNAILALWRFAFEQDLTEERPEKVRKVRLTAQVVKAWSPAEMQQLLGYINEHVSANPLRKVNIVKRDYFRALCLVAYDTALRLGDLLTLERSMFFSQNGSWYVNILQGKTRRHVTCRISSATKLAIDQLMSQGDPRTQIFPLWCRREQFYRTFKLIVSRSKIRPGTFRWIRRASTTHVELEYPGLGAEHAGHSDSRVTFAHYIDRSQLSSRAVTPRPLVNTGSN